ncbi:MAG: chemotaxis protein CheW, partial [Polyangiaceae bacterium]
PVQCVAETMRPLPVEPLVGQPSFVLGVAIVRGVPTPVVDLARLLGSPTSTAASRFVSLRFEARPVAIAVDAIAGVRALPAGAISSATALLGDEETRAWEALGTLDGRLLVVLRAARVVPPPVWEALDMQGGSP